MPYVTRDENNKINGLFARQQYKDQEFLKDSHKDVKNFLKTGEDFLINEQKIQERIIKNSRTQAIKELKKENELPADYPE